MVVVVEAVDTVRRAAEPLDPAAAGKPVTEFPPPLATQTLAPSDEIATGLTSPYAVLLRTPIRLPVDADNSVTALFSRLATQT
jgi:hypothetical protein